MSKRNKLIITLSVAAFLIISLLVGLVVVFAEETQPVERNVNAVYRVINAECAVSATCTYGNKNSNVYLGSSSLTTEGVEGADNILSFENTENVQEKYLKPTADIVLDTQNNSIIFEFKFANTGENLVNATLLLRNNKSKNVEIEFSLDSIDWNKYDPYSEYLYEKFPRIDISGKSGEEAETATFYVKVSALNTSKASSFSVNFEWTINGEI